MWNNLDINSKPLCWGKNNKTNKTRCWVESLWTTMIRAFWVVCTQVLYYIVNYEKESGSCSISCISLETQFEFILHSKILIDLNSGGPTSFYIGHALQRKWSKVVAIIINCEFILSAFWLVTLLLTFFNKSSKPKMKFLQRIVFILLFSGNFYQVVSSTQKLMKINSWRFLETSESRPLSVLETSNIIRD